MIYINEDIGKTHQTAEFSVANPEYEYNLDTDHDILDGYIIGSPNVGDRVYIINRAFLTSYDGEIFIRFLNQFSESYLKNWLDGEKKDISNIRSCLIIVKSNRSADVYINFCGVLSNDRLYTDFRQLPMTRKGPYFVGGRSFSQEDFVKGTINPSDGFILILSVFNVQGLYFHFPSKDLDRLNVLPDIGKLFKEFLFHLEFLRSYHSDPKLKEKIFECGWFPFIRILGNRFNEISNRIMNNKPIEGLERRIANSFRDEDIRNIKESWMENEEFSRHRSLFDTGVESYLAGNYICAIHVLYPRIEGVMRFLYQGQKTKPGSREIIDDLITITKEKKVGLSITLPEDFETYIKTFYFKDFSVKDSRLNLSRHSLGHGTTEEAEFTKIRALQAILMLDQISLYISNSIRK